MKMTESVIFSLSYSFFALSHSRSQIPSFLLASWAFARENDVVFVLSLLRLRGPGGSGDENGFECSNRKTLD